MILLSVSNSCTPDILCWNITQSAGAYSTLEGVLAGFLVSAMIFSLNKRKKRHISIPLSALSVIQLNISIIWFFSVHKINSSVIYRIKVLIQFMIVVGIVYMFKFSVDG